ncbi:MAG: protein kinase, partial [Deltaproteobacteria bacterium]|nr:protein kinase [Deltaproteobacteria bacterium]
PLAHLDLSPQNVMITRDGTLRLIDFGIARFLSGDDPPPLGGRIAGTIGYMSPEQARGEKDVSAAADQYALGILLWEILASRRLFAGNTNDTWRRMRAGDVPDLAQLGTSGSLECIDIFMRLLAAKPEERFAHMGELMGQLEHLSSSPLSGIKPLAALTKRLMKDANFDPFDAVRTRENTEKTTLPENIPTGELELDEYAELEIAVDHGEDTPSAQMRAVVPVNPESTRLSQDRPRRMIHRTPESPFLEPSDSFDQEVVASRRRDAV